MSQPNENKIQTKAEREEKRRQEERTSRRSMALYSIIGVVVVVAALAMMLWNSGVLQRNLAAVKIDGQSYTAADVDLYFSSAYSNVVQTYMNQYYSTPFDTSVSTKKQVYDEESGQTWYDHLLELALDNLKTDVALAKRATDEGYTLSAEAQEQLDASIAQLDTAWISYGYPNRDNFIRANYGPFQTYNRLVELMKMQTLAGNYAKELLNAMEHGDDDYESFYAENATDLDTFTFTQFLFQAKVATTDEDGNPIEMTEEEKTAALEEAKTEQKALAEQVLARLEAGEAPQTLADEFSEQVFSSYISRKSVGSTISGAPYFQWLSDSSRQAGDVNLSEYDGTTVYNYYVTVFESRQLDDSNTADVRHVLVAAEQDEDASEPTQEQYDAAYAKAQELLEQWQSGEATEESFSKLASDNSSDVASAAKGGLIANVSSASNYVQTFTDWALDPSRQSGDTGIVQNTGSSTKGWHIMYYVSSGDPIWKQTALVALQNEDYEQLVTDVTKDVDLDHSMGLNLVTEK